jgi:2-polyprenyl-3-methyl-5-hydroxy-6-metoxy-1,4-benzoquinol methylase
MTATPDYAVHYRHFHDGSVEDFQRSARSRAQLLRRAGLGEWRAGAVALDVGCGDGFGLRALAEIGIGTVSGIDTSVSQVEAARRNGLDATVVDDSARYLAAHGNSFDLISAFDVLEHVPVREQVALVSALRGALRADGRLVMTVPNANSSWAGRYRYIDWTHTSAFTEHSLAYVLAAAGFSAFRVGACDPQAPEYRWWPHRAAIAWWIHRTFRGMRRLEAIGEFGRSLGGTMPLSLNLLAVARR